MFTAAYLKDREAVWAKIAELTRDHECWTYVQPAQKTRDGRAAFLGLKDHYLGASNADNMASKAESKISQAKYLGENRKWNFEKYVRLHVDQHAILDGLKEQGYSGIDERSKVRLLINGILTKDLDTVKTQILSSSDLRNDFAKCVNLYQDFISQSTSNNLRTSNVSAVGRTNQRSGDFNDNSIEADMSVEDRYYTIKEYKALSAGKKKGLHLKRGKRDNKGSNGNKSKDNNSNKRKRNNLSKREIKALKRLAQDNGKGSSSENDHESDASDAEDVEMKSPNNGNRNNKALQRKGDNK